MAETVRMIRSGMTAVQVAEQFAISPSTVNVMLTRVYSRIGVRSVVELRALTDEELDHRLAVNLIARKLKDWKGSMEIVRLWPYVLKELE
jgi:DNA-binding NarL/FixJ family response regulator